METRLHSTKFFKEKSRVGTIDDKIQDSTVMNVVSYFFPTILRLLLVKLRIQLSDMREMTSHRAVKNEAVYCFSPLNRR